MATIATAYVQIVPSAEGVKGTLEKELGGASESAGTSAGSKFGDSLKKGLKTAGKVGAAALAATTTAVAGFAKASVDAGADFDSSMSQVAATMGLTMEEMANQVGTATISVNGQVQEFSGNLREFAQVMGQNTAFSATQAADALNYMALAGYDAQTSMDMLPNVLNLAAAGGMDLARASDMVTDTQTAFGVSLDRTSLMVDEMAKAASTGNTSVEQLGDAFLTVGGLAQELNGGFVDLGDGANSYVDGVQELEIALTAMANAGVKGSEAGTHMRNMLLKLSSPTDAGAKALEEMGVAVFDTEGNMRSLSQIFGDLNTQLGEMSQEEKIGVISDLFNTRDLASAEALLNAVGQDWDKIGASVLDSKISIDDATASIQNTNIEWSKYADINVKDLAADIRTSLTTAGQTAEETALEMAEAFDIDLSDATAAVQAIDSELQDAQGSAQKMADTQLDNLAGDITLFQSALEGAKIAVSDELSPSLRDFVQFGTKGLSELTSAFQEGGIEGAVDKLGDLLGEGLSMITSKLPSFIEAGGSLLTSLISGFLQNTDVIISSLMTLIDVFVQTIFTLAPQLLNAGLQIAIGLIQGLAESAPTMISGAIIMIEELGNALISNLDPLLDAAVALLDAVITGIVDNLDKFLEVTTTITIKLTDTLVKKAPELAKAGIEMILKLLDGIIKSLPKLIPCGIELMNAMNNAIISNLPLILKAGIEIIGQLIAGLIKAIPQLIAQIPQICNEMKNSFLNTDWKSLGLSIIQGIADGIKSAAKSVASAAKEAATGAYNSAKKYLDINSPSKLFRDDIGKSIPEGMAVGIEQNTDYVTKAMNGLADDSVKGFDYNKVVAETTGAYTTGSIDSSGLYGATFTLKEEINLGDTKLKEIISTYTIQKVGSEVRAVKVAQGGY